MSSLCKNDVMFTDNILKSCFHNGRVCMYLVHWMLNSGYGFPLIIMATMVMIMLRVIMMVNDDNNLIMICGSTYLETSRVRNMQWNI